MLINRKLINFTLLLCAFLIMGFVSPTGPTDARAAAPAANQSLAPTATCTVPVPYSFQLALTMPICSEIVLAAGDYYALSPVSISRDLTIRGAGTGSTSLYSFTGGRVVNIAADNLTIVLEDLTVKDGDATGLSVTRGGGILNNYSNSTVTLDNVALTNNTAFNGGGVYSTGTLNITNSTVSGNDATNNGGGVYSTGTLNITNSTVSGNDATNNGGGVYGTGTLDIADSTFSGNSATNDGGGVYNTGTLGITISTFSGNNNTENGAGVYNNGSATIETSTFSGNIATEKGGAFYNNSGRSLDIDFTTMTGNDAALLSGEAIYTLGNLDIASSLVNDTCAFGGGGSPTGGYNIFSGTGTDACGFSTDSDTTTGVTARLDSLSNNGGGTETHLQLAGSVGLDRVPNGINGCGTTYTTDQRGAAREQIYACDVGAVEVGCAEAGYVGVTYTVGTGANTDNAQDLRVAMSCAIMTDTDLSIDLNNETVTLASAPSFYDGEGYNGLPPIQMTNGTLMIDNGTIERDSSLTTCDGGIGDRTDFRLFNISGSAAPTLQNLTLKNGCASNIDDGISHDAFGGAVYIGSNATLFINAVHLTGNSGGAGGAILNWGTLKGANSSFVGNNGQSGAAIGHVDAATTLVNTTISQNTGSSSIVYVQGNGDFNLVNLTLASNTATDAIYFTGVTTDDHTFQSVILSDNSGNNCTNVSGAANLSASGSYSDDATCGFAVQGGADSTTTTLGSLVTAANGTQYHPLFGGDALDGGSSTPLPSETTLGIDVDQDGSLQATPVDIDQRNGSRTINTIDAGAVEISCAHAAYDTALSSVNGYTLGTLNTNLVEDLRMAVLCANRNGTDDLIDLDSRTVTLFYVLAPYDTDGYNAMPSIENSGTLTIKDGTIERDSSLFRCNGGSGDRTDFRFFHVSVAANLTLQDLTLQNGCAHDVTTGSEDEYGGAVYNLGTLNVDTVNFTGNRGNQTGAIYNSGTLNITMGNFTNSRGFAGTAAGGIYNTGTLSITGGAFTDNEAIEGAGIYNSATGTSRINAVHFTGNHGLGGGGIRSDGNLFIANSSFVGNTGNDGAAIHQEGLETIIVNTTFSGNVAPSNSSSAHSILYTELGSTATFSITNSTFADNEAFSIIAIYDQGDHYVHNVIFANNDEWHQCYGEAEIVSATGSYDQTADCGFNARGGKDRATISVGSLSTAANGTQYHPLTGGDPVNGGDASVLLTEADLGIDVDGDGSIESTAISVDQRDGARVIGRALDAGAYEVACSDGYSSALPTANGYTIGTVMTDIAEDLRLAMECANANGTDDRIDLDGQTATLSAAPSAYDNASIGYHGLPIIGNSGSLVIGNGTIERDSALTTCDGTGGRTDFRLLAVSPAADLDLENLVLQNGCAHDVMAGTVYDGYGGGILNFGTLHLNTVHLTGNTALSCGAIYNRNGTIVGANTSFVGNQDSSAYAAAMCQASNGAQTTLVNSTFSQNVSPHADGAVLRVYDDGPVTLINSTFSENTAYSVFYFSRISPASHKLFNLILTDNTGRNCSLAFADGDVNFSATSSFSDDTTCDFASQGGTDNESTLLDSLATAANGTQYYPLIGGTARNGGDNNLLPTETDLGIDVNQDGLIESEVILVDQRGGDRVTSTTVDAGAHEAVCTTGPFSVAAGDERALVEAITCANDETINPGADVITLTASTYTFNGILATADGSNGLPDITSEITINGNNSTIQRDSSSLYSFRLFHVAVAGKLTLNQVTVQNGLLSGGSFGPPQDGGGIYNRGTLTLTNSTLADNSADIAAGGYGGGLANAGTVFIENSTIRDNQAAGYGGGISNGNNDVTSMTNSTLSGNTTTGSYGGGIYNQGTFTVSHSTIVSNTSNSQGGGIYTASGRNSTVANSIIAHNSQDCGGSGTLTASGTNIDVDGQCASSAGSNFTTTDPFILPLQDNGGDTWTHALASNSPAIDTGASADCFATDQRGESRTDWACDIGAYELMFSDSDTVSKTVSTGVTVSFGGTLVKATVVNDGGCLTGITVQRVAGDHPSALTNIQTGRYWTITPTPLGCSGFDVTLTLPYDVTASSRDKACRYTGSGWDCGTDGENTPSTSGPVAMPNIVIRTNISQFSDWAVGAEVGPTAITLRSFSANARASQTSWLVALLSGLAALGLGLWRWVTRNAKAAHEK